MQRDLFSGKFFSLPLGPAAGCVAAKGLRRRDLDRLLYIYVVEMKDTGLCKIGVTIDVDKRFSALQSQNAGMLILRYAAARYPARAVGMCEHYLHDMLSKRRSHGEWFNIPAPCAATIVEMALELVCRYIPKQNSESLRAGSKIPESK